MSLTQSFTFRAQEGMSTNQKKHVVVRAADYTLIAGHMYKLGADEILHRCVFYYEQPWVMSEAHAGVVRGHYVGKSTVRKILQAGLWWPTIHMDTNSSYQCCDIFQRIGKPSCYDGMPLVL